jgi:glycosyltransferase involved in cell wall biosynthesis
MRILLHSVHPRCHSGYGVQAGHLMRAIRDSKQHEVIMSCTYPLLGYVDKWEGVDILPGGFTPQARGQDIIREHVKHVEADIVLSLLDVFIFSPAIFNSFPWAAMIPVDAAPLMSKNRAILQACNWPIGLTRMGQQVLIEAGYVDTLYCPHMADASVYNHLRDRKAVRAELSEAWGEDIGDRFMVAVTSANHELPGRKNLNGLIQAWATFSRRHPDALLYLHTDVTGEWGRGWNINELVRLEGINPRTIIKPSIWNMLCGLYSADYMAQVYTAADCYLNPSQGEGFGVPTIEAQMCGCPAITTIGQPGHEVNVRSADTQYLRGMEYYSMPGAKQVFVSAEEICASLESMYHSDELINRADIAARGLIYSCTNVTEQHLMPVLDQIESDLEETRTRGIGK